MISVIIPTYNRVDLIERAIYSVLNQTYKDIEVIIVDDASTDNTQNVIESLEDQRIRYIRLDNNGGACHARNIGIINASGYYISFLDSDDQWASTKLEEQYQFMKEIIAEVVACNYWYEKNGMKRLAVPESHMNHFSYNELLYENSVTTGAILISKRALEEVGYFDENMPRYQDWDIVLRLAKIYTIYFVNKPLMTLYFQNVSISSSTSKEKKYYALEQMYKKNEIELIKDKRAHAHICWSMGLYSLYTRNVRFDLLKKGINLDGFNVRRFLIYCATKLGCKEFVKKLYGKNH